MLFSQVTVSDYKIVKNEHAELLLQCLPDLYDQLIINITNNNIVDSLSFDDVVGAILEEESRRKNKEDRLENSKQAEALSVTRGRSIERESNGSHDQSRSKSRRRKNFKCHHCGMRGHMKKDCQHNKRNTEKTSNATTSQGCVASTSNDGEILYSEAAVSSKGSKQFTDAWIMDLGVTWHMTPRRNWFCTYESVSEGSVFIGNDHALEIAGVGFIKIKMCIRKIQRVRHMKGLKKEPVVYRVTR